LPNLILNLNIHVFHPFLPLLAKPTPKIFTFPWAKKSQTFKQRERERENFQGEIFTIVSWQHNWFCLEQRNHKHFSSKSLREREKQNFQGEILLESWASMMPFIIYASNCCSLRSSNRLNLWKKLKIRQRSSYCTHQLQ